MSQPKLYTGNTVDRIERLINHGIIHKDSAKFLKNTIPSQWSDHCNAWIENAIGYFPMPLGIANDIPINEKIYHLPLAIEETSVIAGLCKMGKLIRQKGTLNTKPLNSEIIGQVPFKHVKFNDMLAKAWHKKTDGWIEETNRIVLQGLKKRGGGITKIVIHHHNPFLVVHIHCDPCDAMGANLINQAAEYLKPKFETFFNAQAITAILSNLNQPRVNASIILDDFDPEHGEKIEAISEWANIDPHRAATHNKGIFNGIDAMCIATGNDWRAVSAGGHAFAVKDGQYRALSQWNFKDKQLKGTLSIPMGIGTVGGVTKQHPIAKLSLDILNNPNANELAQIIVACGLLQNFAALYALTDDGIVSGHMRLHIANMIKEQTLSHETEILLKQRLEQTLKDSGHITQSTLKTLIDEIEKP